MSNTVMDLIREDFDHGDPWGSAMAAQFDICDWLAANGYDEVARAVGYDPGPFGPACNGYLCSILADPEESLVDGVTITPEDIVKAARVLDRYLNLPAVQAQSY